MTKFFIVDSGFDRSFYSLYPHRITPIGRTVYSHYHGNSTLQALVYTLQQLHLFDASHIYICSFYNSSLPQALEDCLPYVSSNSILSLSLSAVSPIAQSMLSPYTHIFTAYDQTHPHLYTATPNAMSCSNRHTTADFILPIHYKLFNISGISLVTPIIAALFAANPSLNRLVPIPPFLHPDYVSVARTSSMMQLPPIHYPKCPKCYTNVKQNMQSCPHCGHLLK